MQGTMYVYLPQVKYGQDPVFPLPGLHPLGTTSSL